MALAQGQNEIAELLTKLKPVGVCIKVPTEKFSSESIKLFEKMSLCNFILGSVYT